jgi:hypothetical protein
MELHLSSKLLDPNFKSEVRQGYGGDKYQDFSNLRQQSACNKKYCNICSWMGRGQIIGMYYYLLRSYFDSARFRKQTHSQYYG